MANRRQIDPVTRTAGPRPASFDALLYEAVSVPESEVETVLGRCPEPELRDAVRRLLEGESALGDFLTPASPENVVDRRSWAESVRAWLAGFAGERPASTRRRLRVVGRTMSLVLGALAVVEFLVQGLDLSRRTPGLVGEPEVLVAGVVASTALLFAVRARRLGDRTVVGLGYVYLVLISGLAGYFHACHELHRYDRVSAFGPYLVFIGLLPLLFQVARRYIVITACAAALASLAGLVAGMRAWSVPVDGPYLADLCAGLAASIVVAVMVQASVTAIHRDAAAGLRLGSYRLTEKLGEGGMGEVWRAVHPILARPAAVKLVRAKHLDALPEQRDLALRRFRREARTIAGLESNHTVRLFDYGVADDGNVFLAMELLDGIDLRALVHRFGPQPVDRVRAILLQICDSLAEAHEKGLVHRDVKPANVMLCRQGRCVDHVKVLDFGSVGRRAGSAGVTAELTRSDSVPGTPAYLAPELLGEERSADARSDIYSLGCVAYWLLVGCPVFDYASAMMQMAAHLRDAPVSPSARGVELPAQLESLVVACLEKDPVERPATIAELAARLEAVPAVGDWSADGASAWWAEHMPWRPETREPTTRGEVRVRDRRRDSH